MRSLSLKRPRGRSARKRPSRADELDARTTERTVSSLLACFVGDFDASSACAFVEVDDEVAALNQQVMDAVAREQLRRLGALLEFDTEVEPSREVQGEVARLLIDLVGDSRLRSTSDDGESDGERILRALLAGTPQGDEDGDGKSAAVAVTERLVESHLRKRFRHLRALLDQVHETPDGDEALQLEIVGLIQEIQAGFRTLERATRVPDPIVEALSPRQRQRMREFFGTPAEFLKRMKAGRAQEDSAEGAP